MLSLLCNMFLPSYLSAEQDLKDIIHTEIANKMQLCIRIYYSMFI